jgi:hypothetical protein
VAVPELLRKKEFLAEDGVAPLRWEHFKPELGGAEGYLEIEASKTDIYREGARLKVFAQDRWTCPMAALYELQQMQQSRAPVHPKQSIFTMEDGRPLSSAVYNKRMMEVLHAADIKYKLDFKGKGYKGYQFSPRRGGATALLASGVASEVVQVMGRWKSDCYKRYYDTPVEVLRRAAADAARRSDVPTEQLASKVRQQKVDAVAELFEDA